MNPASAKVVLRSLTMPSTGCDESWSHTTYHCDGPASPAEAARKLIGEGVTPRQSSPLPSTQWRVLTVLSIACPASGSSCFPGRVIHVQLTSWRRLRR